MKRILIIVLVGIGIVGLGSGGWIYYWKHKATLVPLGTVQPVISKNLEQYDFDALRLRGGKVGKFELLGEPKEVNVLRSRIKEKVTWTSKEYRFMSDGKWVGGVVNIPIGSGTYPTIVMIRGYAEKVGYYPGSGSWKMADYLAKSGYATVSIDFLGYGLSESESQDVMEARFAKVPQVLDLLATIKQQAFVDPTRIGIWAHSNGGQIALSVLEASEGHYPTVLWAPMTQPFPQSVLDTSESDPDGGAGAQAMIAQFTKYYDARRYAFENYYSWVTSPVEIFQGTHDVWCKVEWQQTVVDALNTHGQQAVLRVVQGDDHNFSKNWEQVAGETIDYYRVQISRQ